MACPWPGPGLPGLGRAPGGHKGRRYLGRRVGPPLLPLRPDPCPPKTRVDLEWDRVLAAVADRCSGPLGREFALALPFAETREVARTWLAEADEAARLLDEGTHLPVVEIGGVSQAIERARIGGVLSAGELRAIATLLETAQRLRRFVSTRKGDCPALFDACATDPSLDRAAEAISYAFEADGTLADRASPRLGELRRQWHAARQRMLSRMEELMRRYQAVLQDSFVTEREGRWVLPVRSDAHERFPGIVHAASSSGATLFVEPRAVVPMGNRLKMLEADVKREEEAIYAQLTGQISASLSSVEVARDALALADVRSASARLGRDLELTFPTIADEPKMALLRARHPLLALDFFHSDPSSTSSTGGDRGTATPDVERKTARGRSGRSRVVPSDLSISPGQAIVISGPNAGGKTVALKTMGLCALLVRSGLPVPCAEGSVVGLFDVVLTDVGDEQSLQKNLSTFSAHISNLATILEETSRGAMVLLDELAGGTDPREGEALAAGVLDGLCARGGAVAATTHFEGLKALALSDPRFINASVGFDLSSMAPTFELAMGVPGRSSALAVARRFGMPPTVIERAERFLGREDREFEALVRRLNDERSALELARAAAEDRERNAAAAEQRLNAEREAAKSREIHLLSGEARELLNRVHDARRQLRDAQARLRPRKPDPEAVREAEEVIMRLESDVQIAGLVDAGRAADAPERQPVAIGTLRKGHRVWIERLRAEVDVLDVLPGGEVRVAAGPLKLTVSAGEIRTVTPPAPAVHRKGRPSESSPGATPGFVEERPIRVSDNTCDLRGLRVDDGIAMATSFLDRAVGEGVRHIFLVHGQGTGALRDALRKELSTCPYVARFESGNSDRGGDGVTVVWLA